MASPLSLGSRRNLWDPYQVLDIYPNSRNSSCVGLAKTTGRRCRWSFYSEQYSDSQLATAVRQLDSMAAVHPSDVTPAQLHSLARNTLCRDFHQGQAYDVERDWRATIDAFVRENGEMLALAGEVRQLAIDIVREREAAEADVRKARQALEASQSRCSDLVEKNDRLEGEHAASARDFALLKRQLVELQTDAKSLSGKVEQQKRLTDERHASFEKYAAAKSNEMKALRESKARLDGLTTTNTMEISSLKQKVQALDARAKRSEEEANDLRQELETRGREIVDLQEAKASSEKKADLSEQEAKRTRQELRDSNARHEALETRSSDLETKYDESKKETIEQDRKIGQLVHKMDVMRQDFQDSKDKNLAHTSQLRDQDREMKQLVGQMGLLNKALIEREVSRTGKRRSSEEIADIWAGKPIAFAAPEKGPLCENLEAAAEGTREENLQDHDGRIHSLCAERCLICNAQSSALCTIRCLLSLFTRRVRVATGHLAESITSTSTTSHSQFQQRPIAPWDGTEPQPARR